MKRILILLLSCTLFFALAKEAEVDYLQLAALLLKDGHVDRAYDALQKVDTNSSTLDKPYYYMVKGLILTKKGIYDKANEAFTESIKLNPDTNATKPLYLYIAQNSFKSKDYKGCIEALNKVPELVEAKPKLLSLKAECYWRAGEKEKALDTLQLAMQKFPKYLQAYKQRFYYYMQLHLYQAALEDATKYLQSAKPNPTIMLNFINALRKSNQIDRAIELAEKAKLIFPHNPKVILMLGHLYIDKGMLHAAADLFDEASAYAPKYNKEAAELYRRAKEYVMALLKNAQMLDTKEKYKQRIAIYLDYGDFERVIAARSALERNGLLENENMRYALAYAYFKEGEFKKAEELLATLKNPDLFKKATKLRMQMQKCRKNIWECRL